jgi:tRNA threonylcarbamoyladenosine biosynthesis protein TsaB
VIVLGFDTATPASAVGLRLDDGTVLEANDDPGEGERPGHVTRLLGLAAGLLERAGLDWGDVQRIAVGLGPGTFTGLRIGVASARGLAQSLSAELVGVSTLHALAVATDRESGVLAAIDARRGEAFVAAYAQGAELLPPCVSASGELAELLPPCVSASGELAELLPPSVSASGKLAELLPPCALAPADLGVLLDRAHERRPDTEWLAVGDGAVRYREAFEQHGATVPADISPLHRVSARAICRLALDAPAADLEAVLPEYVRRPDAEIALQGAGG